jgi:hypothetical protein
MTAPVLPPLGPDWKQWGRQLSSYLSRQLPRLFTKSADDNPSENGILLWDEVAGYPVVSKNGEWRQVVLEDGHADYIITADVTAAATNTAYKLTYDAMSHNHGITLGTPASRIVFEESGQYVLSFSAQVSSTSSSTVHFYFWPSINGTNVDDSAMTTALHQNNATMVTSRTQVFTLAAGDYLEVNWMADNTSGFLNYTAAASPRPALPASTLSITRLHG